MKPSQLLRGQPKRESQELKWKFSSTVRNPEHHKPYQVNNSFAPIQLDYIDGGECRIYETPHAQSKEAKLESGFDLSA